VADKFVICVVDDDAEVRESITTFFRSAGIFVEQFDAAEALLRWPGLDQMGCLITDVHMPGVNGLDLQRKLTDHRRRVPVIMMTAYPSLRVFQEGRLLGVRAFLVKPIDPEQLLDEVKALLQAGSNRDIMSRQNDIR